MAVSLCTRTTVQSGVFRFVMRTYSIACVLCTYVMAMSYDVRRFVRSQFSPRMAKGVERCMQLCVDDL